MREIYKTYSQKGKKRVNITTISVALLVAATFVLGAAAPVMSIQTHTTKLNINAPEENIISAGPAPRTEQGNPFSTDAKSAQTVPAPIDDCFTMYGHMSWSSNDHLLKFDTCDPGTLEEIGESISGNPCSGGTYGCDGVWYLAQYDNGLLYGADIFTGDMWSIGGGGQGLNTLAYSPIDNRMYGVYGPGSPGNDLLLEIDPDTGEQTEIGTLGGSIYFTIGMAFDAEGTLYGWDVATDSLFTIDTETGEATTIGPLGFNLNYGQDGDFHRESDVLYLTAVTGSLEFGLILVDKTTGQGEWGGDFPYGSQITGSCFENYCIPPEHDVAIKSIDSPQTGRAEPDMDMLITVKNYGNNTETFDAQMEIIKCEAGPLIYEEYFDDCVMPDGWETDYWTIVSSNNAGGEPCEARCYKYDQYYGGQYYDNYIMSPQTDCTGLEKVNLRYRWAADYGNYAQYASVYVKFRRNSTSPWKDVTPWDNPVGENQDGELYEIGCYGFGEPMGDEFQMMWQYVGYYYYFNYLYLDDITLEACGGCAEYAELTEDITLDPGEEAQVSFPGWTPSEWQNETSENTWEEYPIHAFVILEGDENPRNDDKWILIDLWYPWMHDIEVMSIDSPSESGRSIPGQVFPVQATMRNVGQFAECCIPIDISIGNPFLIDTLMEEYDWPGSYYRPGEYNGWTDEHKYISYYYGWRRYYGSYSGGDPYEAYLLYYYARQDYVFYSAAIDTSDYQLLRLRFLTYINHYSGQGLYSLEAGYSTDGETWYAAWHEEPGSSGGYEVDVPIEGGSETTYIGFWVKGNPYYFNYWYLDNVELVAMGFTEEYNDFACQGPDLEPGEEATFVFEDWTPARLLEETSGSEDYIVEAFIEMEGDKNPANDILTEELTLDFWWDAGIDEVTSPVGEGHPRGGDEVLWDNGEPNGENGLAGSMYNGYSNILIDDIELDGNYAIQGGKLHFLWNSGYSSNMEAIRMYFFEETGDCDPSLIEFPEEGFAAYTEDFTEYTTGTYYFGRPEVVVDFTLPEEVILYAGNWWIGIQPDGITENIAYLLTADGGGCEVHADLPYWGYPRWSSASSLWGTAYDLAFEVHGRPATGPPAVKAWIQPGSEDIESVVMNYGTFIYEDLIAYAQVREFITDPENGTEIFNETIENIDLSPLGGSDDLDFGSTTFANEGRYGLYIQLPAVPDDEDRNNKMSWGVAVDDTEPFCDYPPIFDPEDPTGENDWYVDDVTVTLNATDPWSNGVSSGVKEIRYTVNGEGPFIIDGKTGSFVLTEDGDDILVEYWAVDWVGNAESPVNSFTIDIDQTIPEIQLTYEIIGGNPYQGWDFEFTATATDAMSGMERCEFYFNNELQETVTGSGPEYVWTLRYWPIPKAIFRATGYDFAGLFNSDEIIDPTTQSHSSPQSQESQELPHQQPKPR
jgi:hypothetical protein